VGPTEMMGIILAIPEVSGGSSSSTDVPAPASLVSQPEPSSGVVSSILGLEAKLTDLVTLVETLMNTEGALVVWAGSSPSDTLVASDSSPSVSSLVSGPFTHNFFFFSNLGFRNGLDFVSTPKEEPSPLSCCPSEKVKGFSGKESLELLLKMALEYSTPMGITCVGSEGQLPPLFMDLIASHDKKEEGTGSKSDTKGRRELNRLFCSVNYDAHSGNSSSGRHKGRVHGSML